jgi:hypothetical protein
MWDCKESKGDLGFQHEEIAVNNGFIGTGAMAQ